MKKIFTFIFILFLIFISTKNVLGISIIPQSKEDCKNNGWKNFLTLVFKNQGSCVSYLVANENANKVPLSTPTPTPTLTPTPTPTPTPTNVSVDLFRVSSTGYSEKYFTIYDGFIYWHDSYNGIYKFDPSTKQNQLFIPANQLPENFFAFKAYDGKYLVYDTYSLANGYKAFVWDLDTNEHTVLPGESNSFTAYDLNQGNIVYMDNDSGTGDIYVYNIVTKVKRYIDHGAVPRISGNYVTWYNGGGSGYIIKAYDISTEQFINIPNPDNASRQTPDVYGNKIVFEDTLGNEDSIKLFNISTQSFETLTSSSTYHVSWPTVTENYVVWGKNTAQHVSGVEGINLITKEVFEIQEQGPHQNDNMSPMVLGDIVGWMAWRTGNGDIYGAKLN